MSFPGGDTAVIDIVMCPPNKAWHKPCARYCPLNLIYMISFNPYDGLPKR